MSDYLFDLLIIYNDGSKHIVNCVSDFKCSMELGCFQFIKNGYRGFAPINQVRFFGRLYDYGDHNLHDTT